MDHLLKKRYTNLKAKKPGKAASNIVLETLQETLERIAERSKKEGINWVVLKNLQKLSLSSRDSIEEMSGSKVVNQNLKKYQFLDNERIVIDIFL